MKVILNKDVQNLGEEGDIKDVARGYARNYLIPNRLVMPYSTANIAILESRREEIQKRRQEKVTAAQGVKERLESESLTLMMPAGENGRLFGSVTSATIAEALDSKGIPVERKRIDIPEKTIKVVGTTRVRVRLYGDEEAELRVVVEPSGGKPAEAGKPAKPAPVAAAAPAAAPAPASAAAESEAPAVVEAPAETRPDESAEASVAEEPQSDEAAAQTQKAAQAEEDVEPETTPDDEEE